MAKMRKTKKTSAAQEAAPASRKYSRQAVVALVAALFIGLGFAAYAGNAILRGRILITEHRMQEKTAVSTLSNTARSDSIVHSQSTGGFSLSDQYGPAAQSPAVAAAIRNAQASDGTNAASVGTKAAADRYEALEHGHPLPGTDPMQLIMQGYVPPGMPPEQAAMLYNSLPNNLKSPHVLQPGSPEWIAAMSHEPVDPASGLPFSLKEEQVQAGNQKIAEECMRDRFGPISVPPLNRGHNAPATKSKVAFGSDHQGSITEMTDASGNIVWQGSYDPYGNVTTVQGTTPPDFMYRGMYHLQRPDLYMATNGRVYSTKLGRWLTRDPLGESVGTNLYGYAGNDPINRSDPSGYGPITAGTWGAAGATAGYFAGGALGLPEGGVGAIPGSWAGAAAGGALGAGLGWLMPDPKFGPQPYQPPTFCQAKPPKNAYDPNGPKAPGYPGAYPPTGYEDPKGGPNWVPNPNGSGYGWQDAQGNVWVPTGPEGSSEAHGGPHWDVQTPGSGYDNIYPNGLVRPGR